MKNVVFFRAVLAKSEFVDKLIDTLPVEVRDPNVRSIVYPYRFIVFLVIHNSSQHRPKSCHNLALATINNDFDI